MAEIITQLIRPAAASSNKNTVNLLDETLINRSGKYALLELTESEKKLLRDKKL
jgi:hypothetical protein